MKLVAAGQNKSIDPDHIAAVRTSAAMVNASSLIAVELLVDGVWIPLTEPEWLNFQQNMCQPEAVVYEP